MYHTLLVLLGTIATGIAQAQLLPPDFANLTVRTRVSIGLRPPLIQTLYMKGPRLRMETHPEIPGNKFVRGPATIFQCDQKTIYELNGAAKTFRRMATPDPVKKPAAGFPVQPNPEKPQVVHVTVEAVDTGDRYPIGPYQARRVRTTARVEPDAGARALPAESRMDGWYLDLPGLFCRAEPPQETWFRQMRLPSVGLLIHRVGDVKHGFVIREVSVTKQGGKAIVSKTELLEVSEKPLDAALFEVPADYSVAAPGKRSAPKISPDRAR